MGQNQCKALDDDLNNIAYKLGTSNPSKASYITVCIRLHGTQQGMTGDALNGKSRVKVELNEHDTVENIKRQLITQGVVNKSWCISALHSSQALLQSHLSLNEQGVDLRNSDLTVQANRKFQCMQLLSGHTSSVYFASALSDGRVMSASEDGSVRYWTSAGAAKQVIRGLLTGVGCLTLLNNNGKALVTGSIDDNMARVWEAQRQWKCSHMLKGHSGPILSVASVHNGNSVATGSSDCTVRVWNTATGGMNRMLSGHSGSVLCVTPIDFDDDLLLSGSVDCTVRLWSMSEETCIAVLEGHTEGVTCLLPLTEGRAASGSKDNSIRIWDLGHPEQELPPTCLAVLEGHTSAVTCLLKLESDRLLSGSLDYTARVWGLDGSCIQVLHGHSGAVACVGQLAGNKIVTGSYDYNCRVWEEDLGQDSDTSMQLKSTWFTGADEEQVDDE
eukprot:TRINITY_DN27275_c0_g1_i2.p1 TRINITY_DN27275_c0_g1~~TRINITY_DN27275_c0_g1_i2.p1  ORF type:complete len:444 (-),score=96.31 TRINITY_DN27275_c0_g1_i2:129-1460(-)